MFGKPPDDPLLDALRANPTLAIAALTAGLSVARLMVVSRFQPETALALLQSGGIGGLLIAFGITGIPAVSPFVASTVTSVAYDLYHEGRRALLMASLALSLIVVAVITAPAWLLALAVAAEIASRSALKIRKDRWARKHGAGEWTKDHPFARYVLPLISIVSVQLFVGQPWFPSEIVHFTDGTTSVVYVVSEESGWASLMTADDRLVLRVPTSSIDSRVVCSFRTASSASLLELLRPSAYPLCRQ